MNWNTWESVYGRLLMTWRDKDCDPFYYPYVGRLAPMVLNSLKPNWTQSNVGSPNSRRQSSARILIKVAFSDTMPQIVAEWKTFVSHAPYNVLRLEFGTPLGYRRPSFRIQSRRTSALSAETYGSRVRYSLRHKMI
jgi:hypothetical protein